MAHVLMAPHGVHKQLDWKAGVWAGLGAGLAFMILEILLVAMVQGDSPWGPPRMIGAIALGRDVLSSSATITMGVMMAAMLVHFILAVIYGLGIGWIVHKLERLDVALMLGAAIGLAIYLVNFYLIAPALFPWFEMARNWISILTHIVFGMLAAGIYLPLRHKAGH